MTNDAICLRHKVTLEAPRWPEDSGCWECEEERDERRFNEARPGTW